MSLMDLYKKKLVTAEQAAKVVKSGDFVEYGSFLGHGPGLRTRRWPPARRAEGCHYPQLRDRAYARKCSWPTPRE